MMVLFSYDLIQGSANFFCKGQMVSILDSAVHIISATTILNSAIAVQKQPIDNTYITEQGS